MFPLPNKTAMSLVAILLCSAVTAHAQKVLEVIGIEGTVKAQRNQKQKWEKIAPGEKLQNNDLIETFFQSKLLLKTDDSSSIIFGSNSKALLNLKQKDVSGKMVNELNISLFNGGLFVKTNKQALVNLFSTSAVGEIDSGSLSMIVDAKTGETGFQCLGGKAAIRTISQQQGQELNSGMTSMVVPGRDPSPATALSVRHAGILKQFFGDQYIDLQLKGSSISPVNDQTSSSKISFSESSAPEQRKIQSLFYKKLFNLNTIYGSILEDRYTHSSPYYPILAKTSPSRHPLSLSIQSDVGSAQQKLYPRYSIITAYQQSIIEGALRFSIGMDQHAHYSNPLNSFSSTQGILDKIHHLTIGHELDSLFIYAGELNHLTIGQGLMVNNFSNRNPNSLYHAIGLNGVAKLFNLAKIQAFLADVSRPTLGGIHVSITPAAYFFGLNFITDRAPYAPSPDSINNRYTTTTNRSPLFSDTAAVTIYEFNFGTEISSSDIFSTTLSCDFAQKRSRGAYRGFVVRAPDLSFKWPHMQAGIGWCMESGQITSREFNQFYFSRPSFIIPGSNGAIDTLLTRTTALGKKRSAQGFVVTVGSNPYQGIDCNLSWSQNLLAKNASPLWIVDSTSDSNVRSPKDYSLDFSLSIDHRFLDFIEYATVYMHQIHGRLYPRSGKLFSSWDFESGFAIRTKPLFADINLEAGGRIFYLDFGPYPDNRITNQERSMEFYAGIRWSFL